jgi:RimJ/RimL family protein N-acetyltransferase
VLRHDLPGGAALRLLEESDADELFALTGRNREHLWLSADEQGRGTMTEAVRALVDHAFGPWNLHRVEIGAAVGNARSRAIPERLGFRPEGVRRRAERVGDRFLDLVVYAMLAADWP